MKIRGKDLALYVENKLVALATSCNIDITADMIEVSSNTHGRAKNYLPGKYSWQITTNSLVNGDDEIFTFFEQRIKEGTRVLVRVTMPNELVKGGYAFVYKISLSGSVGSMATYSAILIGDGSFL